VARVEVTARALRDLERQFDFVAEADPKRALAQPSSVRAAFEVLADHPLPGRLELVLSRGKHGHIAKYRWLRAEDVVLVHSGRGRSPPGAGLTPYPLTLNACAIKSPSKPGVAAPLLVA